ncbi:hypothetical protein Bca4012_036702 [Brassica carinata]|uniref:TF-B3 domain-containing protein n=1 Tax=Brassica carinata TaxID=52824 RepID=A0A8X7WBH8_BRACI|nr:hypothetical protein Bca52824_010421 [Brassica carinata]
MADADDNRAEDSYMGENICLDLLGLIRGSYGEDETKSVRGKEEDDSVSTELCLGKRKIDDGRKNQQNPTNYWRQDNASSSSSLSLSLVVSEEPIRAEPLREVNPPAEKERGVTPPEWLVNLMRILRCANAKLVIDKMVQRSDVNANQGRLLIPFNQIIDMDFLNEAELNIIDEHQREDNNKRGLDVIVVASDGTKWNASLRRWNMTCPNYALCSGWNAVVRDAELENKVGQIFSLWSFHSQDGTKLYLAFFHQPPPRELSPCEVALRQLPRVPTGIRTRLVCVPSPQRVSEVLDLINQLLGQETAPLEAEQEMHDRRTSLESVTETTTTVDLELRLGPSVDLNIPLAPMRTEVASLEAVQETSQESARETTRVDPELRLFQ